MKTKNKFLLIPDDELHRLEKQYGYTSKTEVINEVRSHVNDRGTGMATGETTPFHCFQMATEVEEKIEKIVTRANASNRSETRTSATR